jgi:hypothetical protein
MVSACAGALSQPGSGVCAVIVVFMLYLLVIIYLLHHYLNTTQPRLNTNLVLIENKQGNSGQESAPIPEHWQGLCLGSVPYQIRLCVPIQDNPESCHVSITDTFRLAKVQSIRLV